jgi:hypothetical protein
VAEVIIGCLAIIVLVALVLGGVWLIKPGRFRVKAGLLKLFTLDVEIENPRIPPAPPPEPVRLLPQVDPQPPALSDRSEPPALPPPG